MLAQDEVIVIRTNVDPWLRFKLLHVRGIDLFLVHKSFTRLGLQQETTLEKWMQQILKNGMLKKFTPNLSLQSVAQSRYETPELTSS
jgi:hypothetical protein